MNITELPQAKQSPRFENGILMWYYKDTFTLLLNLELKLKNELLTIKSDDIVTVHFYLDSMPIYTFTCTNISNNTCELIFNEEISKKFIPGEYTYCIKFNNVIVSENSPNNITTIGAKYKAIVETCI